MKSITLTLVAVLFSLVSFGQKISADNSKVEWVGHKVVGSTHTGTVAVKGGELKIKKGALKGGEIEIDLTSLSSTDLEGEWKQKLDGHLKSGDFFDVEKYPTAKFVLKSATKDGDKLKLTGDMTIKGVSQEVAFDASLKEEGKKYVLEGAIEIDRTKFGLKYGSDSFFDNLGDKAISNNFDISFKVTTL
ncbi:MULTISPECIES: YceI family protein [unclassified Flammeovirga]|uniref:YceI family protein n=1 Tax=unclassified Flammeovirga TaxID=2637820 RepID=UPI0005C63E74|nr:MULTISPECIES: YceI family protein [unclassified Flammeovirga]MBD0403176.1 YceI family protein [Flammeovirga sp. EKP202]